MPTLLRGAPLAAYATLQTPRAGDVAFFRRVLGGLSCREYEACAERVPEAFGLARSSVAGLYLGECPRAAAAAGAAAGRCGVAGFGLDGKAFAGDELVVALGVTVTGEKRILALVQTSSENRRVIAAFLRALGERGFPLEQRLLALQNKLVLTNSAA